MDKQCEKYVKTTNKINVKNNGNKSQELIDLKQIPF